MFRFAFVGVLVGCISLVAQERIYVGFNFWQATSLAKENPQKLTEELDSLQSLGVKHLRVLASFEGPDTSPYRLIPTLRPSKETWNEDYLKGLDFLLVELKKRDMQAVLVLSNFWHWSGGFPQLLEWSGVGPIPYYEPDSTTGPIKIMKYASQFFDHSEAQALYKEGVEKILRRVNVLTNQPYINDTTIEAWQLANEPTPYKNQNSLYRWVEEISAWVHSIDPNHPISTGSIGTGPYGWSPDHIDAKKMLPTNISYMTVHLWPQNWMWYFPSHPLLSMKYALRKSKQYLLKHAKLAKELGKDLVLEEFNLARDDASLAETSATNDRDHFIQQMLRYAQDLRDKGYPIRGVLLWAWAGNSRKNHDVWQPGDAYIGDPPHEPQGWYSIYNQDFCTLDFISIWNGAYPSRN